MHGLTGGSWKRNHDQATATEKNDLTGNRPVTGGSATYRRSRSPRQLSTLRAVVGDTEVWIRESSCEGPWQHLPVRVFMGPEFDTEFSQYRFPYVTTLGETGYEWQIPANIIGRFNELTVNRSWLSW